MKFRRRTTKHQGKGGSQVKTCSVREFVIKGEEVFMALKDSKRTWKMADAILSLASRRQYLRMSEAKTAPVRGRKRSFMRIAGTRM